MKNYKETRVSKSHGFSLIELMVTIAIIGILSGIAIPNFQSYVLHAKSVGVASTVRGLAMLIQGYQIDKGVAPGNPTPGTACVYSVNPASSTPGCLAELGTNLINGSSTVLTFTGGSTTDLYVRYYAYGNQDMPVIETVPLAGVGSPCPFATGSWCNTADPGYATSYCVCPNGGAHPP